MATRAKFIRLAQYLREFSEASHTFLKNGLWRISASLASPLKSAWHMLRVWQVLAEVLGECRQVWRVLAKTLGKCWQVWGMRR